LARYARIVICGAISTYNDTGATGWWVNSFPLLVQHATMTGFVVFDYASRYAEGLRDMAAWVQSGEIRTREQVVQGLETFPETLQMLFTGANNGKLVLAV
jgi:NADPH-dependent curcumin reductase CurA